LRHLQKPLRFLLRKAFMENSWLVYLHKNRSIYLAGKLLGRNFIYLATAHFLLMLLINNFSHYVSPSFLSTPQSLLIILLLHSI
jgi:hypothetical protein